VRIIVDIADHDTSRNLGYICDMKKLTLPLVVVVAVLSIIGNVLAYFHYSGGRPLITVNGVAITRKQLQERVDYLYSKQLLSSMIWQQIVMQAAAKSGCVPSDSDVEEAVNEILRSSPSVVQNARRQDPTLMLFKADLKSNLALRNLRMVNISVTPDEVQQYYNQHKLLFQLPQQIQTTLILTNNATDAETAQHMLLDGVSTSIIAQQPGIGVVGVNVKLSQALPNYVGAEVLSMKPGDVKVIPVGNSFAIVKARAVASQGVPPFNTITDQVRIACILSKAPSELDILKKLRANAQITAEVSKYAIAIPVDASSAPPTTAESNP
jgi:hypothetical protein